MATTRAQLDGMLQQCAAAAQRAGIPGTEHWRVDNAPILGGACIETGAGGSGSLGDGWMDSNRMPPRYLYQALRMVRDVLEAVPTGSDDMLRGWVAAQVREHTPGGEQ